MKFITKERIIVGVVFLMLITFLTWFIIDDKIIDNIIVEIEEEYSQTINSIEQEQYEEFQWGISKMPDKAEDPGDPPREQDWLYFHETCQRVENQKNAGIEFYVNFWNHESISIYCTDFINDFPENPYP
jgi:hypothetical protein